MTSKTTYAVFTGTCEWAMVRTPDEKYDTYKITLDLDKPSIKAFKSSGLQLEPKEEGGFFKVTFRREAKRLNKDGSIDEYGPPSVFQADGKTVLPPEALIGNGSTVAVKVVVFDTKKGPGHRLAAIRVDDLIPYAPVPRTQAPMEF